MLEGLAEQTHKCECEFCIMSRKLTKIKEFLKQDEQLLKNFTEVANHLWCMSEDYSIDNVFLREKLEKYEAKYGKLDD